MNRIQGIHSLVQVADFLAVESGDAPGEWLHCLDGVLVQDVWGRAGLDDDGDDDDDDDGVCVLVQDVWGLVYLCRMCGDVLLALPGVQIPILMKMDRFGLKPSLLKNSLCELAKCKYKKQI